MASISKAIAVHTTLSGTTVDTVTLTGAPNEADVLNEASAGGANLYVTSGWTGNTPAEPTASGDDTRVVPPGGFITIKIPGVGAAVIVKIIGNGNAYSVEGR